MGQRASGRRRHGEHQNRLDAVERVVREQGVVIMVLRLIRGVWLLILGAVREGYFGLKTMILLGVLARTGLAFDFGGTKKSGGFAEFFH